MKAYDPQQAARVWQRVQGQQSVIQETNHTESNLLAMIMEEWISAVTYIQLARRMQSREASVMQRLFREKQTHIACLKGIYTLITGEKPIVKTPAVPQEAPELTLRKCYGREMRTLKEYEARTSDSEYGPVFSRLAEQGREHCRALLEIIGGLQKK